jgi:hypothetical protein
MGGTGTALPAVEDWEAFKAGQRTEEFQATVLRRRGSTIFA